ARRTLAECESYGSSHAPDLGRCRFGSDDLGAKCIECTVDCRALGSALVAFPDGSDPLPRFRGPTAARCRIAVASVFEAAARDRVALGALRLRVSGTVSASSSTAPLATHGRQGAA